MVGSPNGMGIPSGMSFAGSRPFTLREGDGAGWRVVRLLDSGFRRNDVGFSWNDVG